MKRLVLVGFGHVHRHAARILLDKAAHLAARYGFAAQVVGVADSSGAVVRDGGIDLAGLLAHKESGGAVAAFPGGLLAGSALDLVRSASYDILLEASPVNLVDGEPGLSCVRAALEQGRSVVLANKAPLVLDFAGLHALARRQRARLGFSATVCGGLPVINVGCRDLAGATVHCLEGIFNSTTNYILDQMAAGESYASALAEAQRRGIAETDPSLDVEGWDTANKLVILANAVLGVPAQLKDVKVQGIMGLSLPGDLQGHAIKLVARAERRADGTYELTVGPRMLAGDHFLAGVSNWQMGIVWQTDIFEEIAMKIDERGPLATAAAMWRDVLDISGALVNHLQ